MGGARAGEQEQGTIEGPRWRRRVIAGSIVVVLLVVFAGSALTSDFFSAFPKGACKGVGYGPAIDADLSGGGPPVYATPEEALAAVAPDAPSLGGPPVPADGWEEYRGRWVRDLHDGRFYEMGVHETPNGWIVGGDFAICGH